MERWRRDRYRFTLIGLNPNVILAPVSAYAYQRSVMLSLKHETFKTHIFVGAIFLCRGQGHRPVINLSKNAKNTELVPEFWKLGLVVDAVCRCAAGLDKDKDPYRKSIFEGRRATMSTNEEELVTYTAEDLGFLILVGERVKELWGQYEKVATFQQYVMVDGQLYAGQNPTSAKPSAGRIVQDLKK